MQTLEITLTLILLSTGLVLNTTVLLYFVIRSVQVIRPKKRLRFAPPPIALAVAPR